MKVFFFFFSFFVLLWPNRCFFFFRPISAGFNVVRLQWSNELVAKNPIIEPQYIAANPQLTGARALDVYTAAVEALNEEGVYVILDNHMSDAGWCCTPLDGNGLWFNRNYTEETFFQHWEFMVDRYKVCISLFNVFLFFFFLLKKTKKTEPRKRDRCRAAQ